MSRSLLSVAGGRTHRQPAGGEAASAGPVAVPPAPGQRGHRPEDQARHRPGEQPVPHGATQRGLSCRTQTLIRHVCCVQRRMSPGILT